MICDTKGGAVRLHAENKSPIYMRGVKMSGSKMLNFDLKDSCVYQHQNLKKANYLKIYLRINFYEIDS